MKSRGNYDGTDPDPGVPLPGGGGWWKVAAVAIFGVVIYLMMPSVGPAAKNAQLPQEDDDLDRLARAKGFPSARAYEEAVIAVAREQQASGAEVHLRPELAHLESQI